ncbi:Na+/H+ antiporter NhaA [Actinoplanes sp. NPDC049265]|uniref:Na+/H+ antiporter NhaA n=1 Tax=Actinoplanes sp. NPDC049265 TaxID=3363902 RepID=UPI00371F5EDF
MATPRLFSRGSWPEAGRIAELLRTETVGGLLLAGAAAIALIWANSPWAGAYERLSDLRAGPLSLAGWAADGLLAIFFFVAGLELKREFVAGDLRDPRRAALPVVAAAGGMAVPALIFVLVNAGTPDLRGWAIPTATDIAFALAVLGLISTHLPAAMRTFLLTLAVVDDLLAIAIIAIFYTSSLHLLPLAGTLLPLALFGFLAQTGRLRILLLPLAVLTWFLMHESGIHPTVAGVLLAFTVPVRPGVAQSWEHRLRPLSAGFAVPVFAFFAAGVAFSFRISTITLGAALGLILGKAIGITGATWLVQRVTRAEKSKDMSWWDVLGLGLLGGIGFTVALLVGELAFGAGTAKNDQAKLGVLAGTLLSALLATVLLRLRNRHYRRIAAEESVDADADGVPDVYQDEDRA